ncbi:MAG TPA: hypothetical protein VLF79_00740 [Candidatus Saccharimonadales bacterium]|nr:hypothetical protein [Candidatus Saccharimonadales bacterium]
MKRSLLVVRAHRKISKSQDDRLLKRLSLKERRQQEAMRRQIMLDPLFKTI